MLVTQSVITILHSLNNLFKPVQDAAAGFVKQLFIIVTSEFRVVHVVPSHFPAMTAGRAVIPPYVPETCQTLIF